MDDLSLAVVKMAAPVKKIEKVHTKEVRKNAFFNGTLQNSMQIFSIDAFDLTADT